MASSLALRKLIPYTLRRLYTIRRPFIIDRDVYDSSLGAGYRHDCYESDCDESDNDESEWDKKETDDSLSIHMDMPGLGKEDVKVVVEQNSDLIIQGETKGEYRKEDCGKKYTNAIYLSKKLYKTDQIKAEMKNGVLKVVVPKVKEEDRPDVFHHVKVE